MSIDSGADSANLSIDLYIVKAKAYLAKNGKGDVLRASKALEAGLELKPNGDQLIEWSSVKSDVCLGLQDILMS